MRAWADPSITRWNPPPADRDLPAAEAWIEGWAARWRARIALDLVIAPAGEVIGELGLCRFSTGPARAEVGIWIDADHRGRGVAGDVLRRVGPWALAPDPLGLGLTQLWARTAAANIAAEALFTGSGWSRLGEADHATIWVWPPTVLR